MYFTVCMQLYYPEDEATKMSFLAIVFLIAVRINQIFQLFISIAEVFING